MPDDYKRTLFEHLSWKTRLALSQEQRHEGIDSNLVPIQPAASHQTEGFQESIDSFLLRGQPAILNH